LPRDYLVKGFFWHSYFETAPGWKVWVSKQSYLTGFVSAFSGIILLFFLYLTVGSAVDLSYSVFDSKINSLFLIFLVIYIMMLAAAVFAFFKDIFSAVTIESDGKSFMMSNPITVKKYLNLFFLREHHPVISELAHVAYSKVFFDFFSKGANFYYNIYFVFRNGAELKFPPIYTTVDMMFWFLDDRSAAKVRFGHFTKEEAARVANFFGVPIVYRD